MWRVRSVVATLAVLIVFVPSTASQAVTPGFNGRIGYVYNREIHTRNAAGTGDRILTTVGPKRRINEIAWSPDGSQLAFTNDIALAGTAWGRINIINADGTGRHVAVPTSALPGRHPNVYGVDWSPGGGRLAIYVNHGIMIARVDGSNVHKISGSHYDIDPSWSPDGRHLVVAEVIRADRTRLVVMRPDGTHRRTIVEHGLNLQPSWSPDRSTIVYSHGTDADPYPLYLFSVRPDGSHRRSFTEPTDLWQESPTWSPDGSALLLVMRDHIWMMSADGTLGIRVTRPPHLGWAPAWQPVPASP